MEMKFQRTALRKRHAEGCSYMLRTNRPEASRSFRHIDPHGVFYKFVCRKHHSVGAITTCVSPPYFWNTATRVFSLEAVGIISISNKMLLCKAPFRQSETGFLIQQDISWSSIMLDRGPEDVRWQPRPVSIDDRLYHGNKQINTDSKFAF